MPHAGLNLPRSRIYVLFETKRAHWRRCLAMDALLERRGGRGAGLKIPYSIYSTFKIEGFRFARYLAYIPLALVGYNNLIYNKREWNKI